MYMTAVVHDRVLQYNCRNKRAIKFKEFFLPLWVLHFSPFVQTSDEAMRISMQVQNVLKFTLLYYHFRFCPIHLEFTQNFGN